MTLDELKALKVDQRVWYFVWDAPIIPGTVHAIDGKAVEIHWRDGTSTLIWFAHCPTRDERYRQITTVKPQGV